MPRRMCTSSSVSSARLSSWFRRGISFLGAAGSRKPICTNASCQCCNRPSMAAPSASAASVVRGCTGPAAQRLAPVVGQHLHRLRQVQRTVVRIAGHRHAGVAAVHVFVGKARSFGAEHEGHAVRAGCQLREVLARGVGGRAEVARRHGRGTGPGDAVQRVGQRGHDARGLQHIGGAAGHGDGLFVLQHVGKAGLNQHQVVETHHLHRACRGPHIAGVACVDQHEARAVATRLRVFEGHRR